MTTSLFMKKTIAQLVPHGSRVLDLGCGDGALLEYLQQERGCSGYGVEIDDANIAVCINKGVQVLQLNLEQGLSMFDDSSFDVVLQIDTLQHLKNAETMLQETLRVGKTGVIAFPNFAHWFNRWSVMHGRMPVTPQLPYEWYDTPNIRVGTFADFQALAAKNHFTVKQAFGITDEKIIRHFINLRSVMAVFQLVGERGDSQ